ncbi:50S ribosomal protein L15 [Phycisphaera mikurensis]|uniref:Large ribosomal subunit protein uL15 n=1 Tax=Phycisphaera mikurensis (strain NBRC 102666 / KCTC 22515 / FYK2301M01) TaxID=1142394 RepID=I0IIH1_PHYMF|nr:large subunit ribosomal protein L15 [Phycisphaera mikurensis]BAM05059.1 50S ribosomal protein L15 [Phycisphaera mikurensis NBRC 102666]
MMIHEITPHAGAHKRRKRIGRGPGSGHGKTSGRGHKGMSSRSGSSGHHEGGGIPFYRRFPKRGFSNANFRRDFEVVNLKSLEAFDAGTTVTPELLAAKGLVRSVKSDVKVLGFGDVTKPLTLAVAAVSASAREKITAAGGSVTEAAEVGARRPKGVKKAAKDQPADPAAG